MNYFLVDYENVNVGGLNGVSDLTENDTVIIFYSEKADTLTFEMLRIIIESSATFKFQKVLFKEKNALDFQLCSYLGFLIRDTSTKENLDNKYFIVANDKGYSILPNYWKKFGVNLKIICNLSKSEINPPQPVNNSDTSEIEQNETPQPVNNFDTAKTEQNETSQPVNNSDTAKTEQNETPQPVNISATIKTALNEILKDNNVVSISEKIIADSNDKKDVHNNLVKKFGTQRGVEIYRSIKSLLAKGNSNTPKTEQNKTSQPVNISETIKSTLNKILNDKNATAELTKMIVASKARTAVNNILCKKFGSQKGGEIYRSIKTLIKDKK